MFTGLITAVGTIARVARDANGLELTIAAPYADLELGEKEEVMPLISYWEEIGIEKGERRGLLQAIALGLEYPWSGWSAVPACVWQGRLASLQKPPFTDVA